MDPGAKAAAAGYPVFSVWLHVWLQAAEGLYKWRGRGYNLMASRMAAHMKTRAMLVMRQNGGRNGRDKDEIAVLS
jgi:hypothetical protein